MRVLPQWTVTSGAARAVTHGATLQDSLLSDAATRRGHWHRYRLCSYRPARCLGEAPAGAVGRFGSSVPSFAEVPAAAAGSCSPVVPRVHGHRVCIVTAPLPGRRQALVALPQLGRLQRVVDLPRVAVGRVVTYGCSCGCLFTDTGAVPRIRAFTGAQRPRGAINLFGEILIRVQGSRSFGYGCKSPRFCHGVWLRAVVPTVYGGGETFAEEPLWREVAPRRRSRPRGCPDARVGVCRAVVCSARAPEVRSVTRDVAWGGLCRERGSCRACRALPLLYPPRQREMVTALSHGSTLRGHRFVRGQSEV